MSSLRFAIMLGIVLVVSLFALYVSSEEPAQVEVVSPPVNTLQSDPLQNLKLENDILKMRILQHRILIRQIAVNYIKNETDSLTILEAMESIQ